VHKSKQELYDLIKDLKTFEEFEEEIKKRYRECDELIDEDTLALFIVDELGRNKHVTTKIGDLKPNGEYTIVGKVISIYNPRTFKKKNGTSGRVIKLDVGDETGICRLVLWDKDIDLLKSKGIKEGTIIKLINGYTKEGYSGLEINLGRWGLLEVDDGCDIGEVSRSVEGILVHKEPTRAFLRNDGDFGFITTIKIKDEKEEKELILWDEQVKEIQRFKIGERILIKNVISRRSGNKIELHVRGEIQKG
jgi:replication factor A1